MLISVVVPCFNEAEGIEAASQRLRAVLGSLHHDFEVVYVNDGSSDETGALLLQEARNDPRCRVLSFSRNFGHQTAVTAGIDHARGDAVVLMDADMQDPPELIPEMIALWETGYQVVYGARVERQGESILKRGSASLFYRLLNRLSEISIPNDTGDFRLMDRTVVAVLRSMPERDRFIRGMVSWIGFRQVALPYRRHPRLAGESKYPFWKLIRLALGAVTSFSTLPLRMATWLGFLVSFLALIGVMYTLIVRLFTKAWVPGWAGLFIAILFLGGVQLITLGIMGEYIGRIYEEVKRRPLYVIDQDASSVEPLEQST